MSRQITAILIDPFEQTVKAVSYDATDYRNIYTLISHETMPVDTFDAAYVPNLCGRDAIFVDDEGLFKDCDAFFRIDGYDQPLAGKGLVVGCDDEGESQSAATSLGHIAERVTFLRRLR